MGPDDKVVIEVFGEGKTDVGHDPQLRRPQKGVVPTLLHKLCGKPQRMRVKCYTRMYLEKVDVTAGGGYRQRPQRSESWPGATALMRPYSWWIPTGIYGSATTIWLRGAAMQRCLFPWHSVWPTRVSKAGC